MGSLRSVAAVVLILAALSACGGGEGAANDGVLHGNSGTTTSSGGARLLFSSGFEGSIALSAPSLDGNGAWQDIVGTDSMTGSTWPDNIWGGGIRSQMIVDAPVNATTLGNAAMAALASRQLDIKKIHGQLNTSHLPVSTRLKTVEGIWFLRTSEACDGAMKSGRLSALLARRATIM